MRETLSYTWVGFVGIGLDFLTFLAIRSLLDMPPAAASLISAAISATLTFPLNARFTFKKKDILHKRFVQYLLINGFGTLLGSTLVFVGYNMIGLYDWLAKAIATVVVAGSQFVLNKFVAFK